MGIFSKRAERLESEINSLQQQLRAAQELIPTTTELRNLEHAQSALTAVAELVAEQQPTEPFRRSLLVHAEGVGDVAGRQPEASRAELFRAGVIEYKNGLRKYITGQDGTLPAAFAAKEVPSAARL